MNGVKVALGVMALAGLFMWLTFEALKGWGV